MTEHRGFYPDRRDNDVSPRIALASPLGHCAICRVRKTAATVACVDDNERESVGGEATPVSPRIALASQQAEHRARGGSNASTSNGTTIYTPASDSPMTNKAKSRTTRASSAVLEADGWLVRELVQDSPPTGISGPLQICVGKWPAAARVFARDRQRQQHADRHKAAGFRNQASEQHFQATGGYVIDQGFVCSAVRGYNVFAENTELAFDKPPLARNEMCAQFTARRTRAVAINKAADDIEDSLEEPFDVAQLRMEVMDLKQANTDLSKNFERAEKDISRLERAEPSRTTTFAPTLIANALMQHNSPNGRNISCCQLRRQSFSSSSGHKQSLLQSILLSSSLAKKYAPPLPSSNNRTFHSATASAMETLPFESLATLIGNSLY
ncbi:hypothetical protein LTR27_007519 [Elasticomyces elasticus]|nr:hypothetical protein LTR27_007519 [Elasticomyces elasticus]